MGERVGAGVTVPQATVAPGPPAFRVPPSAALVLAR